MGRGLEGEALPRGRGGGASAGRTAAALDPKQDSVVEGSRGQKTSTEARVGPGDGPDGALVAGELGELRDGLPGDVEDLKKVVFEVLLLRSKRSKKKKN